MNVAGCIIKQLGVIVFKYALYIVDTLLYFTICKHRGQESPWSWAQKLKPLLDRYLLFLYWILWLWQYTAQTQVHIKVTFMLSYTWFIYRISLFVYFCVQSSSLATVALEMWNEMKHWARPSIKLNNWILRAFPSSARNKLYQSLEMTGGNSNDPDPQCQSPLPESHKDSLMGSRRRSRAVAGWPLRDDKMLTQNRHFPSLLNHGLR